VRGGPIDDTNERLFVRLDEDRSHGPESGVPSACLHVLPVPGALRPLVAHVLAYHERFAPGEEVLERVLPDGAVRLILHEGNDPGDDPGDRPGYGAPSLVLAGPSMKPALVRLRGRVEGLSITLQPGAAATLFGVPARDLVDLAVPLHELWPRAADELIERLAGQSGTPAKAQVLLQGLARHAPGPEVQARQLAARALRALRAGAGRRSPRELAATLGVGERRLQQIFHDQVGLTPKAASRLARLHGLLRALRHPGAPAWAELAPDLGFYDQAHLANEFRALCGLTPGQFMARSAAGNSKTAA